MKLPDMRKLVSNRIKIVGNGSKSGNVGKVMNDL